MLRGEVVDEIRESWILEDQPQTVIVVNDAELPLCEPLKVEFNPPAPRPAWMTSFLIGQQVVRPQFDLGLGGL